MNDQDFEAYADFKRFNTKVAPTWDTALGKAIHRTGQAPAQLQVLDYGCGDGKYFAHLCVRGFRAERLHGVDVSRRRVERCHEIGWSNAKILVPGNPLDFADASIDIINCMEVIEHIPAVQGEATMRELRRVLRPNGVLLISTPNYPIKRFYDVSDAMLHRKWSRLRDDPTHVTHFSSGRLYDLLAKNFARVEATPFKPGFLYKRFSYPFFLHKLFFLCQP